MTLIQIFIIVFALVTFMGWQGVTTCYLSLPGQFFLHGDIFGAAHDAYLDRVKRLFLSTWTIALGMTGVSLLLTQWWSWHSIDPGGILRPIILISSGMITWRAITLDVELATGRGYLGHRVLIVLAWVGVWFYPGFLIILIHIGVTWLRSWSHHQHMAIRLMVMFLACLGALPFAGFANTAMQVQEAAGFSVPVLFLFLCVSASHYLNPGMKKLMIGRHWYSWMRDNRLHSIAISAYLWGWLRFLPEAKVIRLVQAIRPFDVIVQVLTVVIEVGVILILFDQRLCLGMLIAHICFHLVVGTLSGILFWQFIIIDALLFWGVYSLPPQVAIDLFGFGNGVLAVVLLLLLPFR